MHPEKNILHGANYCKKTLDIFVICYYNRYAVTVTGSRGGNIVFIHCMEKYPSGEGAPLLRE